MKQLDGQNTTYSKDIISTTPSLHAMSIRGFAKLQRLLDFGN